MPSALTQRSTGVMLESSGDDRAERLATGGAELLSPVRRAFFSLGHPLGVPLSELELVLGVGLGRSSCAGGC